MQALNIYLKFMIQIKVNFGFWYTVWVKRHIIFKSTQRTFKSSSGSKLMFPFIFIKASVFFWFGEKQSSVYAFFYYECFICDFKRLSRNLSCWLYWRMLLSCWSISSCAFSWVVFVCVFSWWIGMSVEVVIPSVNKE